MVLWLLQDAELLSDGLASFAGGASQRFLVARVFGAAITALVLSLLFGVPAIRWLGRRCGERIDSGSETLNVLHAGKNATPTMGGVFVVAAVIIASLAWGDVSSHLVTASLIVVLAFTMIGAADDWIKLSTRRRGLTARQKLFAQVVVSGVFGGWLFTQYGSNGSDTELLLPMSGKAIALGSGFPLWVVLVLVGSSNAVNLTDGLDGLAGGCTLATAGVMGLVCYLVGSKGWGTAVGLPYLSGVNELAVVVAALCGAVLGFLWFNCFPAQVFMGDAGALPIGALLGVAAVASRQEAMLAIAGGVFVVETLSVIAQVSWFRLTGSRLIACSPLHNHFVFRGHHEMKIVVRFWICSVVCAVLALACLRVG